MAYEGFSGKKITDLSDNLLIDELELVLKQIVSNYEDRHSQKPKFIDFINTLNTVITSNPEFYVSDPKGLNLGKIYIYDMEIYLDITEYKAMYIEQVMPNYYVILQDTADKPEFEVIKIPTFEVWEQTLICEYEILVDEITDNIAETLIIHVLLLKYSNQNKEQVNKIGFINLKSNVHWTIPYSFNVV
jgi:hypothetical protein